MIITTRGIVFRFTKYRETSIITHIYTEELGLNTYIVNSVRTAKAKFKIGYFEPLSLVELTGYHKQNRDIDRLTEIKSSFPALNIGQDIYKSTISIFIAEVLNKCIVERHKNSELFGFLYNAVLALNNSQQNNSFHLHFMVKLAQYLGFGIHDADLFVNQALNTRLFDDVRTQHLLQKLIETNISTPAIIPADKRNDLLDEIVHYYRLQIDMPKLKSLEVLHTVFN